MPVSPSGQKPSRDQYALSLRIASSLPTLGVFNLFNAFRSRAKAGVNCSGQGLHATNPQTGPKMSIVLSTAIGPTPVPRNFGVISMQSMINRSHPEASYSSCTSSFQQPVSKSNRSSQYSAIFPSIPSPILSVLNP